jgi:SpoVK/Ycf46/Vps4 family AAA+-type ATPase
MLIHRLVIEFQLRGHDPTDHLKGLIIKDEEIEDLLDQSLFFNVQPALNSTELKHFQKQLATREAKIASRKAAALQNGTSLRLEQLKELFSLSPFDIDTLLICLAPELDLRFEKIYAYLQDDVTKKRPGVELILKIIGPSLAEQLEGRVRFHASSPLMQHKLLQLLDDPSQPHPPLLSKYIKMDHRVVDYLLGSDRMDDRLMPFVDEILPEIGFEEILIPGEIKDRFENVMKNRKLSESPQKPEQRARLILYFQGPYGVGKRTAAAAICHELGQRLLHVDLKQPAGNTPLDFDTAIQLVNREALFQDCALYFDGFDALMADDRHNQLAVFLRELASHSGLCFLAGEKIWEPVDALHHADFLRVEFSKPGYLDRIVLWHRFLEKGHPAISDGDLNTLANSFRLTGGQIRDAATTARNLAKWRNFANGQATADDFNVACRLQSNRKLAELAQNITPLYKWEDIVLPHDRLRQLREICSYVKYRSFVYDEWGFDRKLSLGKGLNVLFAGPSGTGKTMAAEIMAGELGLELYKIDLSTVVSKYIGETEKNLARIFTEAETSNSILFFDEADSLFGKRSEVKDSHDRYANIEISYLLQRMEQYEGMVILASNLQKNMDEAFMRRMHFNVEFPLPNAKERGQIWQKIWPLDTPCSPKLDLNFMAHRFEITGGNIRNIALASAFLAAADGKIVTMEHLIGATQREYQKMGKLLMREEFGEYADHLEEKVMGRKSKS